MLYQLSPQGHVIAVFVVLQDLVSVEEGEEEEGNVVEEEMAATSQAVEEAARRIQVRSGGEISGTPLVDHTLILYRTPSISHHISLFPPPHPLPAPVLTSGPCRRCLPSPARMTRE